MSLFSIVSLNQAVLLEGSFAGIGFAYEKESADESGRRIEGFMFPGQDIADFQDLGQFDGDIVVHGIVVGNDYAAQIGRLRAAFLSPGPWTLVHPWLGSVQVVQSPGKQPRFTFSSDELRVGRFTAVFRRYLPNQPSPAGTLQSLLFALEDARTAAYAMLASVLAPVSLTLAALGQVESLAGETATILGTLVGACSSPLVGIAGGLPIFQLSGVNAVQSGPGYAASVGAVLAAPTAAIAATTTPAIPSAVAPGGNTATPAPVDGRITAALILSAVAQTGAVTLSAAPVSVPPGPALILCLQTLMLADAAGAASAIAFVSQQEALAWRDRIVTVFNVAVLAAAALVPSLPAVAPGLWQALIAAKAAWVADINTEIGRLPAVTIFNPPAIVPVWLLAQYLCGDTPQAIVATFRDLVARNSIFHPGIGAPGPLEVLA